MFGIDSTMAVWSFIGVQVLGFASAWLARLTCGYRSQTVAQMLFFLLLAMVGLATIIALGVGPGYWLASGSTLSTMVLIAICDFSRWRAAGI